MDLPRRTRARHIQAIGVDTAGRRQYLYRPEWRRTRDEEKHDRVLALARRLPELRAAVGSDLDGCGAGRERVLAAALCILDLGVFRTGGEELRAGERHPRPGGVAARTCDRAGGELMFRYPAKGRIQRSVRIRDEELVRAVKAMRRAGQAPDRLLAYREDGGWYEIHAHEINERFKELAGEEFTAKDLRIWKATVLTAVAFADTEPPASRRGRKRAETAVMREVAEGLGNTPAVARRSSVDPQVVRAFNRDLTIRPALRRARTIDDDHESRALIERAVVRLLGNRGLCDQLCTVRYGPLKVGLSAGHG